MLQPLDELKSADLPEKKRPNWKLWGPGAILVGLSIGAGEIIIWPRIAAEYGASMVWAAILGVILQLWINFEIGRWTVATGETIFTGFARAWRGFAPIFIMFTVLGWLAPGWGRASGLALKALLVGPEHNSSDTLWTCITFALVALALFGPKIVYKSVERTIGVLIVIVFVGLVMVACVVGTADKWKDLAKGAVNVGHIADHGQRLFILPEGFAAELDMGGAATPELLDKFAQAELPLKGATNIEMETAGQRWTIRSEIERYVILTAPDGLHVHTPGISIRALFIALVFAGAGGTANLFYTFYLRDKHIGMGARMPEMQNPLRGTTEKAPSTGFIYPDTPENGSRFRSWWRFIRQDQLIFFWLLNTVTILLFIFAALAVLHPIGKVPSQGSLIWDQADILGQQWGTTGRTIFLLVGVATLFSTQLTILDGCARSMADIVYTNVKRAQNKPVGWWYVLFAAIWIIAGCVITAVMEARNVSDLGFLFSAAYMGGFAMAVYVPLTLFINLKYLPKSARPGPVCVSMMIIASLVYVGFAAACLLWELGILKQ